MRQLHDEVVKPIATEATKGAWYRQWRLVSLDGSTLDVPDESGNPMALGDIGADGSGVLEGPLAMAFSEG